MTGEADEDDPDDERVPSLLQALRLARRDRWTRIEEPSSSAEAAWRIPAHRRTIRRWLDEWPDGGRRLLLRVELRPGIVAEAVFRREVREVGALRVLVVTCARGTVFAGRRLDGSEPPLL